MSKIFRCGLLEVSVAHPYFKLLHKLVENEWDVVGFYYQDGKDDSDQCYSAILFDIYSGRYISCASLNVHDLKTDPLVSIVSIRPLNLTEDVYSQFRLKLGAILSRELLDHESEQYHLINLRRIIFNESERTDLEGYEIINSMIMELMPHTYSRIRLNNRIIASPLVGPAVVTKKLTQVEDSRIFRILHDLYQSVFNILRDESFNHDDIQSKIIEGFKHSPKEDLFDLFSVSERSSVFTDDIFLPVVSETSNPHKDENVRLDEVRDHFAKFLAELERGEIPVLYLNEILSSLSLPESSVSKLKGSIPAIVTLEPYVEKNDKLNITLNSGQNLILPSRGADLSTLDEETLSDVLWYLDNLIEHDGTFVPLQNLITREIAQRQKISISK